MKKQSPLVTPRQPAKMNKLTSLVYSTAGIGVLTVAVRLMAEPKMPHFLGE